MLDRGPADVVSRGPAIEALVEAHREVVLERQTLPRVELVAALLRPLVHAVAALVEGLVRHLLLGRIIHHVADVRPVRFDAAQIVHVLDQGITTFNKSLYLKKKARASRAGRRVACE